MTPGRRRIFAAASPALLSWLSLAALAGAAGENTSPQSAPAESRYLEVLKNIYREVKELGARPGEDFISREFFLGPADDDTYKNEHIAVLIHQADGREKMKIQVTRMERLKDSPLIQTAKESKNIVCRISGEELTVERAAYAERELEALAPEILRAIQDKKKLLKDRGMEIDRRLKE